ncbi:putative short-chain dehydrogenase [Annulohypoxylon truncatum]|uniref:putative short-chain dehydrogenase n=1 Tax=Annulohypoxylon truncatum TaxID=327061 RepID=UPI00200868D0|nr:putative short-chain dehydrogenase [Annulohypoxylon truncatum]KAI1208435.1 putative short-chain dehydrogenase [Annulohypoxylon truncatum]
MAPFDGNTTGKEIVTAFSSNIQGKNVLITGSSHGSLGAETAKMLASANRLILAGRNESKIRPVVNEIREINPGAKVTFVQVDLASNESVRRAAAEINALPDLDRLDIVINAAGNMAVRTFQTSADGIELQFAANHLGHFLLTSLIMDKILASPAPTVVNLTSMGYELGECNFEDTNFEGGKTYNPWLAYAQAKTANILHAVGLRHKFGSKGLAAFAVHPGYVPDSPLQGNNGVDMDLMMEGYKLAVARNGGKDVPPQTPRTLQEGCATILLAALDPTLREKSPTLFVECNVHPDIKEYAINVDNAKKLWELSEKLTRQ